MVDKEKLAKYIEQLEDYLNKINNLKNISKESFLSNWKEYQLVDRILHLALETFLNIGEMIISEYNYKKPDYYSDVPKILNENKIISEKLKEELIELAKFRNVLVHQYLYLDHEIIYEHLQNDEEILKKFLENIKEFINNNEN